MNVMKKKVNIICLAIMIVATLHVGALVYCMGLSFSMGFRTATEVTKQGEDMDGNAAVLSLVPKKISEQNAICIKDEKSGQDKEAWPLMVMVPTQDEVASASPAIMLFISFPSLAGGIVALLGLIKFVICLNRKEVFSWKTVKYLRLAGYGMLICYICGTVMGLLQTYAGWQYINPAYFSIDFSEQMETGGIIFGLFILLMAEAFAIGLRLQEEQELTI